ncbi:MAG TPA: hypothetical protein DHW71_00820 [Gammaproteobacteria bacterium]|nr:hypothetical protein [Gammaproteobacteria bacterium]MEC8010895.1 DNA-J related domain-containing protein [Pseudomonadota bacterium]HBF06792.1 hypothetical protein [Gammaproteobacteria bacterium]HCK91491.1 hypothetical protein [Gammaproteobacteria bacterium]|tara:strand:+ start:673 stop:1275 length:603 start_codon:yes stop_codon:yes gene_type:complete
MFIHLRPQQLHQWLEEKLINEKQVLKEFQIIRAWQEQNWLPESALSSTLGLFRTHFFVFHQLYYFHQHLLMTKKGWLDIHTLNIEFKPEMPALPITEQSKGIEQIDPLVEYYMDWRPLFETSEQQIQQLMSFAQAGFHQPYRLQAAFDRFEISPPTTAMAIKKAYRRLAKVHHPDKGGAVEDIQMINEDKDLLFKWLENQ